jgi:hypothetical protein
VRILGVILILLGLLLCVTVILLVPGILLIILGVICAALGGRNTVVIQNTVSAASVSAQPRESARMEPQRSITGDASPRANGFGRKEPTIENR